MQQASNAFSAGSAEAPPVKAKLKWFNGPKGFGFVNPEERPEVDAFLHITTLQDIDIQAIGDNAELLCRIDYGDKGAHVQEVLEVLDIGVLPESIVNNSNRDNLAIGHTQKMKGTVKWYKQDKGFGFIIPDDGQKDVFIHKSCLDKHDIEFLETGQRLAMTFRIVPKGREIVSFKILEDLN